MTETIYNTARYQTFENDDGFTGVVTYFTQNLVTMSWLMIF